MNNNNINVSKYVPPPPPSINVQQVPKANTAGINVTPYVPPAPPSVRLASQQGMLPPPPPPEDRGFFFTPMVSKEAVAGAPDFIRPFAEFATELTTPFDVALTAGTALLGGPLAFALRGGVQGALAGRKVNLARRGLAAVVDPVGGGRAALPARVIGETALTAGGHYGYKKGEEIGGVPGGIISAFAGGAVGGVAGIGLARGMGKALQKAPVTRSWFEDATTKSVKEFDENNPTQFRETKEPVYTENLDDMKPSLHNVEAETTQGLINHNKNELMDSWIGRSIDKLPTGVQEFVHGFGRVFNPINHVRKLEHAATIGIFRGEELVRRNTERLMDFVRVNEMPVLFGTTEKRLDITDPESIEKFSFIVDGPLMTPEKQALIKSKNINSKQMSVAQILEESPNPMKDDFGKWATILDDDQKAMLKRIQQVNDYTRGEMVKNLPDDPTRRKPKKRIDDREVLDLLTYSKEELEEIVEYTKLNNPEDALYNFRDNIIGYANRKFVVKLNPDNLTGDIAVIGKDGTAWQIGQRTGSEAQRKLTRISLANLEGYRYASLDDALRMGTRSRLGRAMTQSHSKWLVGEIKAGNLDQFISVQSKKARQYEILIREYKLKEKLNLTEKEIKDIVEKYNNGDFSVQPAVLANIQEAESVLKSIDTILAKVKFKTKLSTEDVQLLRQISKVVEDTGVDISDIYHDKTGEQVIKRLRETVEENIPQIETWRSVLDALPNFKDVEDMEIAITLAWARRLMGTNYINQNFLTQSTMSDLRSWSNLQNKSRLEKITFITELRDLISNYKNSTTKQIDDELNILLKQQTANFEEYELLREVYDDEQLLIYLTKENEFAARIKYWEDLKEIYNQSGSPKNLDFDNQDYIKGMSYGINGYEKATRDQMDSIFQVQKTGIESGEIPSDFYDLDQLKHIENIIGEAWFKTFNPDYDAKNLELFLEKQKNSYFKNLIKYEKIVADAAEKDVIYGNEVVFKGPTELEDWIFKVGDDAPAETFEKLKAFRDSFQETIDRSEVKGIIKWWSQANALQRMVALGFDASIFNIHLLPVLFNHPEVNATGARQFVKAFFATMKDKQGGDILVQNYRAKKENIDIINKYFNDGFLTSDSNEVFEVLKNTGIGEAFRANRITGNLGAAFENAFNHTLDVAGIELLKGLDYLVDTTADAATQASQRKVIVDYVNSMRGLFSSGMQGINPNQSIWESILLLAPRYRRAVAALFVQAFQGDPLRRYLAQKALINTATGLALTTVLLQIGASAIGEDEPEELQVKLDRMLDPSKSDFLLFDMNGQKVGAGSKVVSDARILTKALNFFYKAGTQEDMEEWESFISLSEDNPGLRWIRSQMAYAPSTAWDFFTGADYMGDPTFRKGESDIDTITNFVSPFTELVTPLWLSSVGFDNSHGNLDYGDKIIGSATRGLSEFTGLRAYPQGAAAILREASFDIMNAPYSNLEPFQKDVLRNSLMDQLTPIQEEQVKRGKNDFAIYFNDVDRINEAFQKELIDMTALYPNTPEGNRNMYDRYRQLKSYRRGQLYEIGYDVEFDEPEPSDVESKNTLNKYYKMFDSVRIAGTQLIDWDRWEIEYEKLNNSLTLDQQLVIARNTSRLPIPYQFLERIKYLGEAKEYKRIMKAQQLREDYFIAQGREDLASKARDLFLMQ